MIVTKIIVLLRVPGFHYWEGAPESESYLRARHRHLFTLRVEANVQHRDRDLEFHQVLAVMRKFWTERSDHGLEFGQRSCEDIALALREFLVAESRALLHAISAVEVWEDDECGARLEFA